MNARPDAQRFSSEQLLAVLQVGRKFWAALANDDDDTLLSILTAGALEIVSAGPITRMGEVPIQPGPEIAKRIRDLIGFSAEDCRRMELYPRATCLGPSAIRILYIIAGGEPEPVPDLSSVQGRRIEFELDAGRWLVEPTRAHDRPAIEMIDLKPLLDLPPPG